MIHDIIFNDMKAIRKVYKLKPLEIALILGFGDNVWRNYEKDENVFNKMSKSNQTVIWLIMDINVFFKHLNNNVPDCTIEKIGKTRYKEILKHVKGIKEKIDEFTELTRKGLCTSIFRKADLIVSYKNEININLSK